MTLFKGSGVALITPFENQKVNEPLFVALIEWHIKNQTKALIIGGTTGESATLSFEEKCRIYELAVKTANHSIPVIANTGTNNTAESILLSKAAEALGVDGLLLVTPYYNKPTQRGLYEHFKVIADSVTCPVILYNVPGRTSVNLAAKTTIELSNIKNIIGVKEASGDLNQVKEIINNTKDFQVFSGNDDLIYETLSLGGDGVISVVANIAPIETQEVCTLFETNKLAAKKAQKALDILNDVLFIESNPVPVKTAFKHLGVDVGSPRLPLVEMELENITKLIVALNQFGLKEISL
ncbi:MAG: 4-hydroxy-tetrahydrodipicolinate synthase [Acholeplasmataceae bacterium]